MSVASNSVVVTVQAPFVFFVLALTVSAVCLRGCASTSGKFAPCARAVSSVSFTAARRAWRLAWTFRRPMVGRTFTSEATTGL